MGMFDDILCRRELPVDLGGDLRDGHKDHRFQTKSLACELDCYEIREDGTLWGERYRVEDHSDPNATGLRSLVGIATKVDVRQEQMTDFTGEVVFYTLLSELVKPKAKRGGWVEFSAYFIRGELKHLELLSLEEHVVKDK